MNPRFGSERGRSYDHRAPLRRILRPALGLLLLVLGILYLTLGPPGTGVLGIVMIPLGALLVFSKPIAVRRAARSVFKDKSHDKVQCVLKVDDQQLELDTGFSHATASWEAFIDSKVCIDGVLLYPQRRIFYWIPRTARVEDGTWSDFCDLVARHVGGIRR